MSGKDTKEIAQLFSEIREELTNITDDPSTSASARNIKSKNQSSVKELKQESIEKNSSESITEKDVKFLNINAAQKIDDDIKRMRMELKKSYDLFTNARDVLESISFQNIRTRIKDLHLYPNEKELNEIVGDNPFSVKENLAKLDSVMAGKFRNHPGEFGEIPELSSFFKVSTQLENGLRDLKKQQTNFNQLQKRIEWATAVSDKRTEEIMKMLKPEEDKFKMKY